MYKGGRTRSCEHASSGTLDAVLTLLKSFICVQSQFDSGSKPKNVSASSIACDVGMQLCTCAHEACPTPYPPPPPGLELGKNLVGTHLTVAVSVSRPEEP